MPKESVKEESVKASNKDKKDDDRSSESNIDIGGPFYYEFQTNEDK